VQVARLLEDDGWPSEIVLAGLLHDVLEDHDSTNVAVAVSLVETFGIEKQSGEVSAESIATFIGDRVGTAVLDLVGAVTELKEEEGKKRPWIVRKMEQHVDLRHASPEVAALKAADMLHNLRSINRDLSGGRDVLARFNAPVGDTLWNYTVVHMLVAERLANCKTGLVHAVEQELARLKDLVAGRYGERDRFTGRWSKRPDLAGPADCVVFGSRSGDRIYGLDHWRRVAPPAKGDAHWQPYRSAMELARAWCDGSRPVVPDDLRKLFSTSADLEPLHIATALAEHETRLDDRGRGRQHDLVAYGTAGGKRLVVCVEAKADESFGPTIAERLSQASASSEPNPTDRSPSRVPERVDELSRLVFGRAVDSKIGKLRYQLLHGLGGTIREAELAGAEAAVFLVHEFLSSETDKGKVERNSSDLRAFVAALGETATSLGDGLIGPLRWSGVSRLALYVGKIVTQL
jgi:hypothetical protein